jgi:hypothetical protein
MDRLLKMGWIYAGPEPLIFRRCYDLAHAEIYSTVLASAKARLSKPLRLELDVQLPLQESPELYEGPDEDSIRPMLEAVKGRLTERHQGELLEDAATELGLEGFKRSGPSFDPDDYQGPQEELFCSLFHALDSDLLEELLPDLIAELQELVENQALQETRAKERMEG